MAMDIYILEGGKDEYGNVHGYGQGDTMGTFGNAAKTPAIDGVMIFRDVANNGFYTYNVNTGGIDKIDVQTHGTESRRIQILPGGFYYIAWRLDVMNCNVYNQCNTAGQGYGSFYNLRQNVNLYNDNGTSAGTINASTEQIVFKGTHGYAKSGDIVDLSGSANVSIRVSGKRNKSTGAVTTFSGTVWASDTYKGKPSAYRINTY